MHDEDHHALEAIPAGGEELEGIERLTLRSVGIDIGSSTSHLMFSKVHMQRIGEGAATRFVVVGRELLWKSPIIFTPYLDDGTIDAALLERFVADELQGLSVTVREAATGRWRQTWVDSNGTYLDFAGGVGDDGAMELRTDRDGVLHRMRWTDVERDSLVWHWERERDGGWDELWRIDYRRRGD